MGEMDTKSARELRKNLRFWNNDVLANIEAVALAILDAVEQRI